MLLRAKRVFREWNILENHKRYRNGHILKHGRFQLLTIIISLVIIDSNLKVIEHSIQSPTSLTYFSIFPPASYKIPAHYWTSNILCASLTFLHSQNVWFHLHFTSLTSPTISYFNITSSVKPSPVFPLCPERSLLSLQTSSNWSTCFHYLFMYLSLP